jgi:uncharacterized protein with HEPN domain
MRFLSRDWRLYWNDMRDSAAKIVRFTDAMDPPSFASNELTRDAVLRNLEVIGEAAKHIPPDVRAKVKGLDWRRVIGFRDIVAHAYFGIDEAILWNIVSVKVPELIAAMDEARLPS